MGGTEGTQRYVMAIDAGTTSSRCILFDHDGRAIASAQKPFRLFYPHPGWVEQDPTEIMASQFSVMAQVRAQAAVTFGQIACVGITNQRETTIVWDAATGQPVYNGIVWQCRRTADYVDSLVEQGLTDMIRAKTGLVPDPYFSATKIRWILDNVEGARQRAEAGELLFGTVDTWLIWNLTSGAVHATDRTNASRTMLYNIHTLEWDDELLDLFGIPRSMLPQVRPSSGSFGHITMGGLSGDVEITGVAGDQQSALFGQCCFLPGQAKATYGTGCFLLMNTGDKPLASQNGMLATIAATDEGVGYALEGSVFMAGALMEWVCKDMGLLDDVAASSDMAFEVQTTGGVYIVPAFTGLGAPYWDPRARGAVYGLTRGTRPQHVIRAALEAIAFQVHDILEAMQRDAGVPVTNLMVDGKASHNDFLLQFQADILGCDIVRPASSEITALGAAYLAGLACGYWDSRDELAANVRVDSVFRPHDDAARNAQRIAGWHEAVERTRSRPGALR